MTLLDHRGLLELLRGKSRLVVKSESNASSLNKVILHMQLFGEFIVLFAFNKPA